MKHLAFTLTLAFTLGSTSGALAQPRVELILSNSDDPIGIDGVDVVRAAGPAMITRAGDVNIVVTLAGPGVTVDDDVALASWDRALKTWGLQLRKGTVIDPVSGLRAGSLGLFDMDDAGHGLLEGFQTSGVRSLYVTTDGDPVVVSNGGVQCPDLEPGFLQQGTSSRAVVNGAGDMVFFDCQGVAFASMASAANVTYVPRPVTPAPAPGAPGPFTTVPTLAAVDDDGGAYLQASAQCDTCPNGAIVGIWRVSAAGTFELLYDDTAHSAIDEVVRPAYPSINGNGDFAAYAFIGGAGVAVANAVILHTGGAGGTVTVIAREGDEALDRPGRPLVFGAQAPTGVSLTDDGAVIFHAAVQNPVGEGIFRSTGGVIETLAMTGDSVTEITGTATLTSLTEELLSVSRTGHVAVLAGMLRPDFTEVSVLLQDDVTGEAEGPALVATLYPGVEVSVVGGGDIVVDSVFGPLINTSLGALGSGTGADGFSDHQSDIGEVLVSLRAQGALQDILVKVGGAGKDIVPEGNLTLALDGPVPPLAEQDNFTLAALLTLDDTTLTQADLVFTPDSGDVRASTVDPRCVVNEDGIGTLVDITCNNIDLAPGDNGALATARVEVELFIAGPTAIAFTAVATVPDDSATATYSADVNPPNADLAMIYDLNGSLEVRNAGPSVALGVTVTFERDARLSRNCGDGCLVAEELAPGEIVVLPVAGEGDDEGLAIPATVTSSTLDLDLSDNTAIIGQANPQLCTCASGDDAARTTPAASLAFIAALGALFARGSTRGSTLSRSGCRR
jgi:hypothetical protein